MVREETAYRLGLRIIGFANTTFLFFIYGDRYLLDSKGGYAWSPDHYEEHGNTTFEFEWMIIATYFMLGCTMMAASFDVSALRTFFIVMSEM